MKQQELQLSEQRTVLSVSELVNQLRGEVESRFRNLWVAGEISNLQRAASGHLYFTLKDDRSQLSAVCFRRELSLLRFEPEHGMEVLVRGSAGIYASRGQLQLIAESMEPRGRGALQIAYEQLRQRLSEEGLFAEEQKKPLPMLPTRVGVVTSPTGAAFQDILRVLERRNRGLHVLLYPARVQGESAPREITAGIEALGRRPDLDVLIVTRGGGSLEDLQAFNSEAVARAVFSCPLPVISAVGHEIDYTITDFVADLRAATPSAAAEIVTSRQQDLKQQVEGLRQRCLSALNLLVQKRRHRLQELVSSRGFQDAGSRLRQLSQRFDELSSRLLGRGPTLTTERQHRLALARVTLDHTVGSLLATRSGRLERFESRLQGLSPLRVLDRGFAIVSGAEGSVVRSPDDVATGEMVTIRVARGEFAARREDDDGL